MSGMPTPADGLGAAGGLLATVVHDLRNPLSTVRTNLDFVVREPSAPDAKEAIEDAQSAVNELARALDLVVHLSRALMGEPAYDAAPADVLAVLRADARLAGVAVEARGAGPFTAEHGGNAATLVAPLVEIARGVPRVRVLRVLVERDGESTIVSVLDDGAPLPKELVELALSPRGPRHLRDKASPRRGRYGGLYAVSAIAASIGVTLTLGERDGLACAALRFPG